MNVHEWIQPAWVNVQASVSARLRDFFLATGSEKGSRVRALFPAFD